MKDYVILSKETYDKVVSFIVSKPLYETLNLWTDLTKEATQNASTMAVSIKDEQPESLDELNTEKIEDKD